MAIRDVLRGSARRVPGYERYAAIRKGRTLRALSRDLLRLVRTAGIRGLLWRTSHALTSALEPPAQAPVPSAPEPVDRTTAHPFRVANLPFYDLTDDELAANRSITDAFDRRPDTIETATWFVPYFKHVWFGGIHTICRFMSWLTTEHGVRHRVVVYDNPAVTDAEIRSALSEAFPALRDVDIVVPSQGRAPFVDFEELPPTDVAFCTIWYSAFPLARFQQTKAKFYFLQDFEPMFYPAGTLSALSEATYDLGFAGIVNTPGLGEVYASYGNPRISFVPASDWRSPDLVERSSRPAGDVTQIVIYGRPSTDRNAFELVASACSKVKARYGAAVRIVSAGEEWDPAEYGLDGVVENLGLLPTLEAVRALYEQSDIGVCCMFTRHPSYQPLDYFAAGVAVVTNRNPATGWLLRDEENCLLTNPYPSSIAAAVQRLVDDPELRRKLADNGHLQVGGFGWQAAFEDVWRFMVNAPRTSA